MPASSDAASTPGRLNLELERLDLLAGCDPRSILAVEAAWSRVEEATGITWREAITTARERAEMPAFDTADGRIVAFLEGIYAVSGIAAAGDGTAA